jgi:microcystin-dependent protein/cytoskeletal protein CcmA (bactofilin family)
MGYYLVNYTDTNKEPIQVQDQIGDNSTSIKFTGRNTTSYGVDIAENFLHLLENFASNAQPENPVTGQLWFDASPSTQQLQVFDGENFVPAGNVFRASATPTSGRPGDLWVDTENQQLYLYNGSSWALIGPNFNEVNKTGAEGETITGKDGQDYNVVTMFSNGNRVAIISKDRFSPKAAILGFTEIKQGINVSALNFNDNTETNKLWGTAEAADGLVVSNKIIPAANFLRSDVASYTNYSFSVRNDGGISVGANASTSISTDTAGSAKIYHKTSGSSIDFVVNNGGTDSVALRILATGPRVGINNLSPDTELDVTGSAKISNSLTVSGTGALSIATAGGISVEKSVTVGENLSVAGQITSNSIIPNLDSSYDLGTNPSVSGGKAWRNVYADKVYSGEFIGPVTGSLTGTATSAIRLVGTTNFSITGDISAPAIAFNGETVGGNVQFQATLSQNLVTNKTEIFSSEFTDELLIHRPNTGLRKVTKANLLNNVPIIPAGTILPYAGETPPSGYLFCDGSEITIGAYPDLFAVIGYKYKEQTLLIGINTFALPDMRGRFALGRDSMDNQTFITRSTQFDFVIDDPGDGYAAVSTTYTNVQISGGDGVGLTVDVIVNSLGQVTSVVLNAKGTEFTEGTFTGALVVGSGIPSLPTPVSPAVIFVTVTLPITGFSGARPIIDGSVETPFSTTIGKSSGNPEVSIAVSQLPQHSHNLKGGAGNQYYAVRQVAGTPPDLDAISGLGGTAPLQAQYLTNSGGIDTTGSLGQPIDVTNPFTTINYIIFTGVIA